MTRPLNRQPTSRPADMTHYIDGFVLTVPHDRLDEYKRMVEAVAEIWKEHGALDYKKFVSDNSIR